MEITPLFKSGGVIFFQTTHHRHHPIGREPDRQEKTKRKYAASGNGSNVFDGLKDHVTGTTRYDLLDGSLQCAEKIHADGEIGQQRDQHDQAREYGQEEAKGHTVGTGKDRVFLYFFVYELHQIVEWDTIQPREGMRFRPF